MSEHSVLLEQVAGVAWVTFNRPEVMNALDGGMMRRFRAVAEQLQDDPSVRAIVLRGAGKAFLAGGDVALFHREQARLPAMIVRDGRDMHFAILALRRARAPVLASVHGAVAGAGLSILCAADLAVAAQSTRFSLAYANIGASPDGGSSWFLPRLLGTRRAMELMLLPDLFGAQRALELDLVNWVAADTELTERTLELASRLASGPTEAYREGKRLLNDSWFRSPESQMEEELAAFARCARTEDMAEGLAAFVERRKPLFGGR